MRSTVGLPILIATLLLSNAVCVRPQTKGSFEVAAIKPGDPNNRQSGVHWQTGGRVANTNATLKALIAFAYGLPEEQILGGEKWVGMDEYFIEAKPENDAPIPRGEAGLLKMRALFQSLAEDRFKLKVHRETREGAVYNLTVARGGAKLKDAAPGSGSALLTRAGHFIGTAVPVSALAQILSQQLARPVMDKTGLNGRYNLELTYSPDALQTDPFGPITRYSPPASDDNAPSIFTAIQEQLGLRLESTKGVMDVIVIDQAEKPDAN